MTRTYSMLRRIAIALAVQTAVAQQKCYYPNGKEAPEKPCGSAEGSACCPDSWECLDNGLCHYPPDKLWGRYSCTDQTWKAEGCPSNMCTYNMNAVGGESITQCKDHNNDWCCNADAQHVNCCAESPAPRPFFALADGKAYATVGTSTASSVPNLATITGKADGADSTPTPSVTAGSNSPQPSTKAPSSTPSPSKEAAPTTELQTSLSSGSAGIVTVVRTQVITPTSPAATGAPSSTDPQKKSKLPIIIGCAVGVPLVLALLLLLIWVLRKRSRQSKANNSVSKPPLADEILTDGSPAPPYGFAGGVKHNRSSSEKPILTTYRSDGVTPAVPELAGQAVGPDRPISMVQGRAELDSGPGFRPGTSPHAPNFVGIGGGNGHAHGEHTDLHSSLGTSPIRESKLGQPGSAAGAGGVPPGGYIPYRPNNLVQPHQAMEMSNVTTPPVAELGLPSPPAAELSTVKTPPA